MPRVVWRCAWVGMALTNIIATSVISNFFISIRFVVCVGWLADMMVMTNYSVQNYYFLPIHGKKSATLCCRMAFLQDILAETPALTAEESREKTKKSPTRLNFCAKKMTKMTLCTKIYH